MSKNKSTFILATFTIFYLLLSYGRNLIWFHDIPLWSDSVSKSGVKIRALNALGLSYARGGFFDKALYEFNKSLDVHPFHSKTLNNLGVLYYAKEEYNSAEKTFSEILHANPRNVKAKFNLALVYYKHLDRHRDAVTLFKSIIKSSPRERKAYFNLGNVYLLLGDKVQASEMYAKALEIDNTYIEAREALDKL